MNLDRWSHLPNPLNLLESMDWRHVQMIHSVLSTERPESVIEIGCANGFSCSATIEAVEKGLVKSALFVDREIRPSLKQISNVPGVSLLEIASQDFHSSADCWIIDGDHREVALVDYENAINGGAKIIIAHDTNPEWIKAELFGAIAIGQKIREMSKCYFQDWQDRPNENTIRGLTVGFYAEPKDGTFDTLKDLAK